MMTETRLNQIRTELHTRVAAIAGNRGVTARHQLAEQVDEMRSLANHCGFSTVSCLASRLESALARDIAAPTLLCYLDAIDDAIALEPVGGPTMQQALLASIALRVGA
jgi:hypothetical protein